MDKSKDLPFLVLGNGPSLNLYDFDKIKKNYWTIGCNYIYKKFIPDFICINDIDFFLQNGGISDIARINTLWVLPGYISKMFPFMLNYKDRIIFMGLEPEGDARNVIVNFSLRLAFKKAYNRHIYMIGVGGKGHFYETESETNYPGLKIFERYDRELGPVFGKQLHLPKSLTGKAQKWEKKIMLLRM